MMAMVNNLLLLARADTGKLALELHDVDLGDVALASVERLLPLARRSGVMLATGDLPELIVRGDSQYLGQMLTNLIENGIKYSTGTGCRVWVNLALEDERVALVWVQDNGPGISKEHLPYLFERFYRADKARARQSRDPEESADGLGEQSSGTGLGLSIVQWIVAAHGGAVQVESAVGSGTRFEVRLPLASAKTAPLDAGGPPDDTPMTESARHVHVPVILAGDTDTAPIGAEHSISKESPMPDDLAVRPAKQQGRAGTLPGAFLTVLICQALVFLFAATLHTGAFGVPSLYAAMVVEGLCGIASIFSAYTILARRSSLVRTAFIVQILVLLGVLLGLFVVLRNESIRTPINVGLHIMMLALILLDSACSAFPLLELACGERPTHPWRNPVSGTCALIKCARQAVLCYRCSACLLTTCIVLLASDILVLQNPRTSPVLVSGSLFVCLLQTGELRATVYETAFDNSLPFAKDRQRAEIPSVLSATVRG